MIHPISTLISALGTLSSLTTALEKFANARDLPNGFEFGHSERFAFNFVEFVIWFDQDTYEVDRAFLQAHLDSIKASLGDSNCQSSLNAVGLSILMFFE